MSSLFRKFKPCRESPLPTDGQWHSMSSSDSQDSIEADKPTMMGTAFASQVRRISTVCTQKFKGFMGSRASRISQADLRQLSSGSQEFGSTDDFLIPVSPVSRSTATSACSSRSVSRQNSWQTASQSASREHSLPPKAVDRASSCQFADNGTGGTMKKLLSFSLDTKDPQDRTAWYSGRRKSAAPVMSSKFMDGDDDEAHVHFRTSAAEEDPSMDEATRLAIAQVVAPLEQKISMLKQECAALREAKGLLEKDRESMSEAIYSAESKAFKAEMEAKGLKKLIEKHKAEAEQAHKELQDHLSSNRKLEDELSSTACVLDDEMIVSVDKGKLLALRQVVMEKRSGSKDKTTGQRRSTNARSSSSSEESFEVKNVDSSASAVEPAKMGGPEANGSAKLAQCSEASSSRLETTRIALETAGTSAFPIGQAAGGAAAEAHVAPGANTELVATAEVERLHSNDDRMPDAGQDATSKIDSADSVGIPNKRVDPDDLPQWMATKTAPAVFAGKNMSSVSALTPAVDPALGRPAVHLRTARAKLGRKETFAIDTSNSLADMADALNLSSPERSARPTLLASSSVLPNKSIKGGSSASCADPASEESAIHLTPKKRAARHKTCPAVPKKAPSQST